MPNLILLRHAKSQWNLENRFSGWVDNPLSKEGIGQIKQMAKKLKSKKIDAVYSSPLIRNQETVSRLFLAIGGKYPIFFRLDSELSKKQGNFVSINKNYLPVYISESLNERYYGSLQGLSKEETIRKYGKERVRFWRRSFEAVPPGNGESLEMVTKRTTPFLKKHIIPELKKGKKILIVASHNSLRAIIKFIEKIKDNEIINVEMPFGGMVDYQLDKKLGIVKKSA